MILPITLSAVAAAAVINIWLAVRIGQVRVGQKISVGDGGNEQLIRRMRAQANFTEYTPLVMVLIGAIELARPGNLVLMAVAAIFVLGRVAHGFGMEGGAMEKGRAFGIMSTMLIMIVLAGWAIAIASGF